ncbi:TonB-dependent receptor plug domain-containing protein [Flavobacterium aquatile]|uniref:TonB-dependent receptor n=1 Tax=Flavobacterium aquatile LMG 4008 = ATCC 11947 TaxID=1453498 RepID=A0A095SUG1_9FLAO|nr:TonB-dependent receptor [Flavobacterium aquatile]KGD68222.1 TonB-dependent receptor [Flavobacterium aquatile LMG 4008 = ATCC 11947]OXA68844.1 TonB-dependent receptor [Flavobacterium aquatile] [Flavobacterium aquatile LMG 4008 = ATCC 11947]GEC77305.1 TonB-dependent receptor [Flavobacterium aquatile]
MRKSFYILIGLSVFYSVTAQKKVTDSIKVNELDEVVITGQFEPQSIKKSVFNVRVITAKDIQNLAANNLSDVLNQYLNITVRPSGNDGRSTVSLFGLDARYFKIMIDNVPLVSEAGLGNNTDLSQINLNDVEQIEIVEGSMGVTHGANAVSGILNIITKKSSKDKWNISATAQEETVGKEFELFDKGRHIQSLKVSNSINKKWFASVSANRNDFQGFLDGKQGKDYIENDGLRGYRWLPKEQLNGTALLAYSKNQFRIFYKFEYLDENIDFYNSTVQSGFNTELGSYRYADDRRFLNNRYFHNLNSTGKILNKLNYNVSVSHQKQERIIEDFRYYLLTQNEANSIKVKDQSMETFYSTGTISNFFSDKTVALQLGYEIVNNRGFSLPVHETLENYDFFVSSEINPAERFSIRPGMRFSAQSKFKDQYASSLGLRYLFKNDFELRGSYGNSFRTPTFEELYYFFVNDSHFYIGNENLIPETSTSYEISIKKAKSFDSGLQISTSFAGSFLDIDDKIDMALIRINPSTLIREFQYINISKYQMWNFSTMNQFKKGNWNLNFGAALVGISQKIENQIFASNEKFLYSFNINTNISYLLPKWQTTFSAYYKYNGKTQQFVEGSSEYIISTIDDSNWLDVSTRKSFFKKQLEATIGARNILDITNINQTRANDGAAHGTSSNVMLAYGRSYFLKLTYNLNF